MAVFALETPRKRKLMRLDSENLMAEDGSTSLYYGEILNGVS